MKLTSWIATIWGGRLILHVPLLFCCGRSLILFAVGGLIGVVLANSGVAIGHQDDLLSDRPTFIMNSRSESTSVVDHLCRMFSISTGSCTRRVSSVSSTCVIVGIGDRHRSLCRCTDSELAPVLHRPLHRLTSPPDWACIGPTLSLCHWRVCEPFRGCPKSKGLWIPPIGS